MSGFLDDWGPYLAAGVAVVAILGIRKYYASRSHGFKAADGARYVWNPDDSFTDSAGAAVTDPGRIAALTHDWEELARRTERQTSAIMRFRFLALGIIGLAGLGGAGYMLLAPPRVDDMNCSQISDQAREMYTSQQPAMNEIANVIEVSRTPGETGEVRCTGLAKFTDGSEGPLYMRAYKDGGNTMIASSGSGFE
jgi:hypothetical protein